MHKLAHAQAVAPAAPPVEAPVPQDEAAAPGLGYLARRLHLRRRGNGPKARIWRECDHRPGPPPAPLLERGPASVRVTGALTVSDSEFEPVGGCRQPRVTERGGLS
jgi:hypothetical protein